MIKFIRTVLASFILVGIVSICADLYKYSRQDTSNLKYTLELFNNYQDFEDIR